MCYGAASRKSRGALCDKPKVRYTSTRDSLAMVIMKTDRPLVHSGLAPYFAGAGVIRMILYLSCAGCRMGLGGSRRTEFHKFVEGVIAMKGTFCLMTGGLAVLAIGLEADGAPFSSIRNS